MCWMTFTIEGNIACVIFLSRCNVAFGNTLVLVAQGSLKGASFCSWCNVFLGNGFVVVIDGNLACVRFI